MITLLWLGAVACAARVPDCGASDTRQRRTPDGDAEATTLGVINGYELLVTIGEPETNGGACDVKTSRFVSGPSGFLDASKGLNDPTQLATLAMTLLERGVAGHAPWTGEANDAPPAALSPAPPTVEAGTLTYWRRHPQLDAWVFVTVTLATGAVSAVDQMTLLNARIDPMDRLRAGLADASASNRSAWLARAIELGTDEAMALFAQVAQTDPSPIVRKEAVSRLGNLKPPGAAALLAERLANDPSAEVRGLAATMLGRVGGPEARPALEAAAQNDADAGVRGAASFALTQLGAAP